MLLLRTIGAQVALGLLPVLVHHVQPVRSPPADRIVADYLREMGGLENLRAWKAMKATGRYVLVTEGAREVPFTVWYKAPDKTRVDMTLGDQVALYAFDGRTAWIRNAAAGYPDPAPMPEEQATDIRNHGDQYPFVDYEAKGHRIELVGTGKFEGARVYQVRLRRANGSESLHFFDAESGRELKIVTRARRSGKDVTIETIERDFRRVEWLLLPFDVETRINGQTVRRMLLQGAEILPDLDNALFSLPVVASAAPRARAGGSPDVRSPGIAGEGDAERAAMRHLDFLVGKWEGEGWIEAGPDNRLAFSVRETYRFRLGGLVLDGEGTFRPAAAAGTVGGSPRYGLGLIFFDRESSTYRMWHYGGSGQGHAFTAAVEVDPEARTVAYTATAPDGEPYRFSIGIDRVGFWVARTERPGPDGTWRTTMEFRMRKAGSGDTR